VELKPEEIASLNTLGSVEIQLGQRLSSVDHAAMRITGVTLRRAGIGENAVSFSFVPGAATQMRSLQDRTRVYAFRHCNWTPCGVGEVAMKWRASVSPRGSTPISNTSVAPSTLAEICKAFGDQCFASPGLNSPLRISVDAVEAGKKVRIADAEIGVGVEWYEIPASPANAQTSPAIEADSPY
jgi:hypothetical protein